MNKFVLTDIHGCVKTFELLLKKIQFSKNDKLFILGDIIDRGPNSKGVIDTILKLQNDDYYVECIIGNHEELMLNARKDMNAQRNWLFNGGWTTVESFQADLLSDIPKKYFQFIENMNGFLEVDEFILVHAGINFKIDNPFDDNHSMKWIRNWYSDINTEWLKKRIIIHGHTPIEKNRTQTEFQSMTKNHYLNLDTGCVYKGKRDGLGFLTCFNMTTKELIFQENVDW